MYNHAIIILGCGIDMYGDIGPDAKNSVQLGVDAFSKTGHTCIIMTGNVSYKATFKLSISEAQGMKDYALSLGIPVNQIFVETESKDTLGNLFFTKQNLLLPLQITNVTIVRSPNQSSERIHYIANKVLGSRYKYQLIEPEGERPSEQEREQKSLAITKKWLAGISDGDMDAIYRLMRSKHPAYNSSLSLDSLQELV
ncbi:MAG: YdcF family protein [Candidatus Saccharimonas sp.]